MNATWMKRVIRISFLLFFFSFYTRQIGRRYFSDGNGRSSKSVPRSDVDGLLARCVIVANDISRCAFKKKLISVFRVTSLVYVFFKRFVQPFE